MEMTKILISFDLPEIYVEKIRSVSPEVEVVKSEDREEALDLVKDVDCLFAGFFSKELFQSAKKLKWIQSWGAGVERILIPEVVSSSVIVTNAGGIHATPMSEHVIGMMLCFTRGLHVFIRNQTEKKWERLETWTSPMIEELSGKTLGIVGLGKIGTEIAKKAKCLGMRVIATKRDLTSAASTSVERLVPPADLNQLLAESDFAVLSLPLTKETEGMIGERQLRSMKRTGILINVSRGKIIQENKLVQALKQGWIAGAGLDTFENEPLPENSELWNFKNIIITPHIAGDTPHYAERLTDIFTENLNRFIHKQPLINVVDKNLGY
jgi:phosphoglycerate dehydrogenase-like enzyme